MILAVNVGTDHRAATNTSTLVGKSSPELRLTKLDGTKITSADLAGKTVIVNFWNTWCRPCEQELPALQQWYATHKDDPDVVLLGVPRRRAVRQRAAPGDRGRRHGLGRGRRRRCRGRHPRLRHPRAARDLRHLAQRDRRGLVLRPGDGEDPRPDGRGRAAGRMSSPRKVLWILIGVTAVVVLAVTLWPRRGRLRRGAHPEPRERAALRRLRGAVGRGQLHRLGPHLPAGHRAPAPTRGVRRRDPSGLRRPLRRVDPAEAGERRRRRDRVGAADRDRSSSAPGDW